MPNSDADWILLVDDNQDDELLTMDVLNSIEPPTPVEIARDGAEAMDWLSSDSPRRHSGPPALVLLDLKLPKIDGFEVLRRLREHKCTRTIPVVVLSSSTRPSDIRLSYQRGANSYLRKSMEFDEYAQSLRLAVEYWLHCNQRPAAATLAATGVPRQEAS